MVHHQLVLIGGKPDGIPFNVINQISFLVESLADLRTFWDVLKKEPDISDIYSLTHGNAWSVYFKTQKAIASSYTLILIGMLVSRSVMSSISVLQTKKLLNGRGR